MKTFIDTKTIILEVMSASKTTRVSVNKIIDLLNYIRTSLIKNDSLKDYKISFDIDCNDIEKVIMYNSHIFDMDIDNQVVYLKDSVILDKLIDRHNLDIKIKNIIKEYIKTTHEYL